MMMWCEDLHSSWLRLILWLAELLSISSIMHFHKDVHVYIDSYSQIHSIRELFQADTRAWYILVWLAYLLLSESITKCHKDVSQFIGINLACSFLVKHPDRMYVGDHERMYVYVGDTERMYVCMYVCARTHRMCSCIYQSYLSSPSGHRESVCVYMCMYCLPLFAGEPEFICKFMVKYMYVYVYMHVFSQQTHVYDRTTHSYMYMIATSWAACAMSHMEKLL